jgi:hypothetical protein
MRKLTIGIIIISLLLFTSCKKSTGLNTGTQGGYWTFESNAYYVTTTLTDIYRGVLNVNDQSPNNSTNFDQLQLNFGNNPILVGSYTVVSGTPGAGQVKILFEQATTAVVSYNATGGNGDQKVTITSANGKVTATGSGITLVNAANSADSSNVVFRVTQLD